MGRQVCVFLAHQDVLELADDLGVGRDTLFLPDTLASNDVRSSVAPLEPKPGKLLAGFIVRTRDADMLSLGKTDRGFYVDVLSSPAIQILVGPTLGDVLRSGRLYFSTEPGDVRRFPQQRQKEFALWATSILAKVKKAYRKLPNLDCYVGPHALRWQEDAGGKFERT
jgi:hypothetical protein